LGFYRESSEPTTFLAATLLDSVIDLLQAKLVSTQVVVDRQYDDLLQITAVFGELRQVISNLMLNSLDAIGEGGRLALRASTSRNPLDGSSRIRLTIADDGQGINAAARQKIFQPFFTTKASTGNGLGLWSANKYLKSTAVPSACVRAQEISTEQPFRWSCRFYLADATIDLFVHGHLLRD